MPRIICLISFLLLLNVAYPTVVVAQGWPAAGGPISRAEAEELVKDIGARYEPRGLTKVEITAIVTALISKQTRLTKAALREAVEKESEKRAVALEEIKAEQLQLANRLLVLESADAQRAVQTLGAAKQAAGIGDFEAFAKLMAAYRSLEQKEAAAQEWQELEVVLKDQLNDIRAEPPARRAQSLQSGVDTLKRYTATPYGREVLAAKELLRQYEADLAKLYLPPGYQFKPDDVEVRVVSMPDNEPPTFEVILTPRFAGTVVKIEAQAKVPLIFAERSSVDPDSSEPKSLRAQAYVAGQTITKPLFRPAPRLVDHLQTLVASDGRTSGKIRTINLAKLLVDFVRPEFENSENEVECKEFSCIVRGDVKWKHLGEDFFVGKYRTKIDPDSPDAINISKFEGRYVYIAPGNLYYRRRFFDGSLGDVKVVTNPRPDGWVELTAVDNAPPAFVRINLLVDGNIRLADFCLFQNNGFCMANINRENKCHFHDRNIEIDVDGKGKTNNWKNLNISSRIFEVFLDNNKSVKYLFDRASALQTAIFDQEYKSPIIIFRRNMTVRQELGIEDRSLVRNSSVFVDLYGGHISDNCFKNITIACIKLFDTIDAVEISIDGMNVAGKYDFNIYKSWSKKFIAGVQGLAFPVKKSVEVIDGQNLYWRVVKNGKPQPWNRVVRN